MNSIYATLMHEHGKQEEKRRWNNNLNIGTVR